MTVLAQVQPLMHFRKFCARFLRKFLRNRKFLRFTMCAFLMDESSGPFLIEGRGGGEVIISQDIS